MNRSWNYVMICMLIIFMAISSLVVADDLGEVCGIIQMQPSQQFAAPYQPRQTNIRILVFYIKFSDDSFSNNCMTGWDPSTYNTTRPPFTDDFIDQDPTAPHTTGSLTHYFDTMSYGQFILYGDIYPQNGEVYVPQQPESYYIRDTNFGGGNDLRKGIGLVHEEILTYYDNQINYQDYDNWDPTDRDGDGIINEPDGFVDFVFFAYRVINNKSGVVGFTGGNFTGIATIDWRQDQLPIQLDGVQIGPGFVSGLSYPAAYSTGYTAGAILNHISSLRGLTHVAAHEFGHYWFGTLHHSGIGRFGDFSGGLSGRIGLIKQRLGWIVPQEIADIENFVVSDAFTTGSYYRISIPGTNEYFLLENRQRTSYFEQQWNGDCGAPAGLPDTGLLISHIDITGSGINNFNFNIEPADGFFSGSGGIGDTFKPGNQNEFAPWTNPNSNAGNGAFTDIAVLNIREQGSDMVVDVTGNAPPAAPQNLTITNRTNDGQHPILQWDANTEPDLDHYSIYRGEQYTKSGQIYWDSSSLATTTNTSWTDPVVIINNSKTNEIKTWYRITASDNAANESGYSNSAYVNSFLIPKSSEEGGKVAETQPTEIRLHTNYPNPFNPETQIRLELPQAGEVKFTIFSINGKEIRILYQGFLASGYHTFSWEGRDERGRQLASGVYFYRFEAKTAETGQSAFIKVGKMTLLR